MRTFLFLIFLHLSLAYTLAQASRDSARTVDTVTVRARRILRYVSMSSPWDTASWKRVNIPPLPADTTHRHKKPRK